VWEVIGSATVDGTERQNYWRAWKTHCGLYQTTPGEILIPVFLTDRLLTFAVAMREGKCSLGNQVTVQPVAKALRLVSQELVLD
jgi:NADH:ubiquinone oxidoreductase subunit H